MSQKTVPEDLKDDFTMQGRVPVLEWYIDDTQQRGKTLHYTFASLDACIQRAALRQSGHYGKTDAFLYQGLDKYIASQQETKKDVADMTALVVGSRTSPFYECILFAYGLKPQNIHVVECNPRVSPMFEYCHPDRLRQKHITNPLQYDIILSISSLVHDGLGRYGDKINPDADLQSMSELRTYLKPEGLFFLAAPVGSDCLVWNAHRVYGALRLPKLLDGWHVVEYFGQGCLRQLFRWKLGDFELPVFVLSPCAHPHEHEASIA